MAAVGGQGRGFRIGCVAAPILCAAAAGLAQDRAGDLTHGGPAGPPVVAPQPEAQPPVTTAAPEPQAAITAPVQEERALGAPGAASRGPRGEAQGGTSAGAAGAGAAGKPWFGRTMLALGGVLALAVASGAVARRLARGQGGLRASLGAGGRAPAGIMEILGRYPVGRGSTLVLLKLDRRVLLLSQSAGGRLGAGAGMSTLCEITDPEEVASILVKSRDADGDSMSERFRSMLARFDRGMEDGEESGPERSGRSVRVGPGGDRAEMWDGSRQQIPIVDLTRQPGAPEQVGAAGMLRRRLASFSRGAGEGRA